MKQNGSLDLFAPEIKQNFLVANLQLFSMDTVVFDHDRNWFS